MGCLRSNEREEFLRLPPILKAQRLLKKGFNFLNISENERGLEILRISAEKLQDFMVLTKYKRLFV